MTKTWLRLATTWILALTTAATPSMSVAASLSQVTGRMVLELTNGHYSRSLTLARYGSSKALAQSARGVTRVTGHTITNDILQATLIMFAAASAQLIKDRMERDRVLNGYQPKYEDVRQIAVDAAQDVLCGNAPNRASVLSEVTCSGDFLLGIPGGLAVRGTAGAAIHALIKFLLKANPTRTALIQSVGSMATSFVMLSGFVMTGHLWTEAVLVTATDDNRRVDDAIVERAHNMFGRALIQKISGNWTEYSVTDDGKLAAQVFTNMYNILLTDQKLRNSWIYNGWRFGVARGELIVNLAVLMGAISAGTAAGGALAAVLGVGGWSAGAISFAMASAFGMGVSYATIYFPDLEVGQRLTDGIQRARSFANGTNHSLVNSHLSVAAQAFHVTRRFEGRNARYKRMWEARLRMLLPELRKARESWVDVAIEQYHELGQKVDAAEGMVAMVTEVLKNSALREAVMVQESGQFMTLAQARSKHCPVQNSRTGQRADCDFPLATQIRKIESSNTMIREARQAMEHLARQILTAYDGDTQLLSDSMNNNQLQFPVDAALTLREEYERVSNARDILVILFSGSFDSIFAERRPPIENEILRKAIATNAKGFFRNAYSLGIDDEQISRALQQVALSQGGQ